jgi:glycosyltransferase involved in cell wall biosynthesis
MGIAPVFISASQGQIKDDSFILFASKIEACTKTSFARGQSAKALREGTGRGMVKKILFITHNFPPIGGAGVQRPVKLVKHLPSFGILPLVLTGLGRSNSRWTPEDLSLASDIPAEVPVFRTGSGEDATARRGNRLAALIELGDRVIREHQPPLIFVTMSPFNDALVASQLAQRNQLPWIADLRDPWALDEFQVYRTRWHRMLVRRRMRRYLSSASAVIMNTPEAAARFRKTFPELAHKSRVSITNGYDSADFHDESPRVCLDHFTIVHSGYMHTGAGLHQRRRAVEYRLLGRLESGVELLTRSHYYLLKAIERWKVEDPSIEHRVRLIFVGSPTKADQEIARASSARSLLEFTGFLPHLDCLRYVRGADLLFLPMHRMPPGRRATIVPGKAYEYMATGLPILAAVPHGDARDFLSQAGTGLLCEPDDVDSMVRILKVQFSAWSAGNSTTTWNKKYVEQFERRRLTEKLALELEKVLLPSPVSQSRATSVPVTIEL